MAGQDLPPATDVLTLVFVAWTAGVALGGAVSRMWREVGAGHFKVVWLVTAALGLAGGFGSTAVWIVAALALLTFAGIYRGLDRPPAILTAGTALVVVGFQESIYALAAAALLGAVTNAMLLGHWHLNQPRLGTRPIARLVWSMWAGLAVFIAASAVVVARGQGVAVFGGVAAIAVAGLVALLTGVVSHLVKTRSIMSATGILYLQILLCLVAVFMGSLAALAV